MKSLTGKSESIPPLPAGVCHICHIPLNQQGSSICSAVHVMNTEKQEWRDEFKEFVDNEMMIDYRIAVDFLPFISEQIEKSHNSAIDEAVQVLKDVESYCIQPTGYCDEEKEREIYLTGFSDMRAFKIIKLLSLKK